MTIQTQIEPFSLEDFRKWLEGQAPNAVVGRPAQLDACPLACWQQATGHPGTLVDTECWWRHPNGRRYRLPRWAQEYVELVDRAKGPITAAQALGALEEVEQP